jgi:hypothetical protein
MTEPLGLARLKAESQLTPRSEAPLRRAVPQKAKNEYEQATG